MLLGLLCICAAVIIFFFYNNGYIDFYHPMKKAQDGQIKIACVGDSITYGCAVNNWRKNNYPAVLGSLLGEKYCVNNFGYTNRTAIKTADFPYIKTKLYKKSLDFKPDIVLIMLGANDTKKINWDKEKFICDYIELIQSYVSLPSSPKVYILENLPMFEVHGKVKWQLIKDVSENQTIPAVRQVADSQRVSLIELHNAFENQNQLFADGVHPNSLGSRLLAQKIYQSVFEASAN